MHSAKTNDGSLEEATPGVKSATRSDLVIAAACLSASISFLFALIAYNFVDIDLWHQMALIRESMAAGHLLRTDVYAYSPTIRPWIDHEWGAGVIAYFATLWFGGRAILILKFSLALGSLLMCRQSSRAKGANLQLFSLCSLLAIFLLHLGFFSAVRAQAYTFFFTALLLFVWQQIELQHLGWAWIWLAVFPLWVNLHGGFVVGIGLTILFCVEKLLKRESCRALLLLLAGMLLESGLTPYGLSYFVYLGRALSMSRTYSAEWDPVWSLGLLWMVCFLAALALVAYAVLEAGLRNLPGLAPLTATAAEAMLHRKLLPIFAIVWLSCVPFYLQRTQLGEWILAFLSRRRTFMLVAWAALGFVSILAAVRQKPWHLYVPQPLYPVGPVKYLQEQGWRGNLMVPFRLGAYVSWNLYPAIKVSLDSRYEEVFSDNVVRPVFAFYEARSSWQQALSLFPPDLILIPLDSPVANRVSEIGWVRIYHDRQFDLYTPRQTALTQVDWSTVNFAGTFP